MVISFQSVCIQAKKRDIILHPKQGRIQDFQIEGAQTIIVAAAHINSAKSEIPYTTGMQVPQLPLKLYGFRSSLMLYEHYFEAY